MGTHQAVLPRVRHRHASAATSACGPAAARRVSGRATTNAVVVASVAVIAVDFFVTPLLISLLY